MFPTPDRSSSFARVAIQPVTSESAGPPCGGLYLKPPSRGGLCDGVTTMPSASPVRADEAPSRWTPSDVAAPLCSRIACDTAGVGVYPSRASMCTSTPAAASTSSAVCHAGSDSAWVSRPMKSGPSVPWLRRYSMIAAVIATMCASLNAPSRLEPRWPDVPNTTC